MITPEKAIALLIEDYSMDIAEPEAIGVLRAALKSNTQMLGALLGLKALGYLEPSQCAEKHGNIALSMARKAIADAKDGGPLK